MAKKATVLKRSESGFDPALKAFIESTYDGYWDWYPQEDYEYMSPRFWEILGFNPEEKKHTPSEWYGLIHPDDLKLALYNFEEHVRTKGKHPYVQEARYTHRNGSTVYVMCRGQVVEWDKEGQAIRMIGTHTDITKLKKTELKLQQYTEDLKESNEKLDDFAHIASHDLREPLRGIQNHSTFLKRNHYDQLDEKGQHKLDRICDLSERMEKLTQDLLNYALLGRDDFLIKKSNIYDLVNDIKDIFVSIDDENIQIDISQNLPVLICDQQKVKDLFRNLIGNAIKYNDHQHKKIKVGVMVNKKKSRLPILYVKDNGIGIESDYHGDIFKIFKRLHKRDAYEGGTGSGLTFVKKIIELHGGKIWLESREGEGTTFFFTLGRECHK